MEDTQMEIFDLEEFKTGKFVVHCSTHQMAKDFLKYLSKLGMKWNTGHPLEQWDYCWDEYQSDTVYYGTLDNRVTYGHIKGADSDIRIVKYENLIFPEWEVEKDTTFTKVSFPIEEFKKGKFVVHCDTKEKAEKFLKYLASKGLEWSDGDSLMGHNWSSLTSHTNWEIYKDETCYSAENGIEYCNKDYFEKHIYDIKSVDDFLFPFDTADLKEFPIEEFKKGHLTVICDTKEKAEKFLKYLDSQGLKWIDGKKTTKCSYFDKKENKVCYTYVHALFLGEGLSWGTYAEMLSKKEEDDLHFVSSDDYLFPIDYLDSIQGDDEDDEDDGVVEISGEFPIEKFKNEMIAVHCDTCEKSQQFLSYLASLGIKWKSGDLADEENCCPTYQDIYYSHDEHGLYYSRSTESVYAVAENIKIWEVDDFEYPDNTTETNDTGIVDFVTFNSYTSEGNYEIQLETSDKECYETVGKIIQLYVDKHNSSDKK